MQLFIQYNPFTYRTKISFKHGEQNGRLTFKKQGERPLQDWSDTLFSLVMKRFAITEITVYFFGRKIDCDDIERIAYFYQNECTIFVKFYEYDLTDTIYKKLYNIVQLIEQYSPHVLEEYQFLPLLSDAFKPQINIAVVATMSSGKSTLINALLGYNILPSKNEACTSMIFKINHNRALVPGYFRARIIEHNNAGSWYEDIDQSFLQSLQEQYQDKNTIIEIEGQLQQIIRDNVAVSIIDTPGPNNAQNSTHRDYTFNYIFDSQVKPLILYVMNVTQLGVDDDFQLLHSIAHVMKKEGQQAKDRFLFVINKIDEIDPESESITDIMNNVRAYLRQHGIETPWIFPMSAEIAKVIRLHENNYQLTRTQMHTYMAKSLFLPYDGEEHIMNMIDYSDIPLLLRQRLHNEALEYVKSGDEDEAVLIYSGIVPMECHINQYLEKYTLPSKVLWTVQYINSIITEHIIEQQLEHDLMSSREKRDAINAMISDMEQELQKGEKAQEIRERIDTIAISSYPLEQMQIIFDTMHQELQTRFNYQHISRSHAIILLEEAKQFISETVHRSIPELRTWIQDSLKMQYQEIHAELKQYLSDVMHHNEYESIIMNIAVELEYFALDFPSAEMLINQNSSQDMSTHMLNNINEQRSAGSTRRNGTAVTLEKRIQQMVRVFMKIINEKIELNGTHVYADFIEHSSHNFDTIMQQIQNILEIETRKIKHSFLEYLDNMYESMQNRIEHIRVISAEAEQLQNNEIVLQQSIEQLTIIQKNLWDTIDNLQDVHEINALYHNENEKIVS